MIGMRSHTPIALPGGYGQEDGWFDCQGLSAWVNPVCYTQADAEEEKSASQNKVEEKAPNPNFDAYEKERPKKPGRIPGTGTPIPWGTVVPIGLGIVLLSGAVLFATSKKKKR